MKSILSRYDCLQKVSCNCGAGGAQGQAYDSLILFFSAVIVTSGEQIRFNMRKFVGVDIVNSTKGLGTS